MKSRHEKRNRIEWMGICKIQDSDGSYSHSHNELIIYASIFINKL